jgi:hypothetical protein
MGYGLGIVLLILTGADLGLPKHGSLSPSQIFILRCHGTFR